MKTKYNIIFDCLKPEYNNKPKEPRLVSKLPKKQKKINTKNRFLQSLNSRQTRLMVLLSIQNPNINQIRSIKKLQRRIDRQLGGGNNVKKYKNKIVRKHKTPKCPQDYKKYIESKFWAERKNLFYRTYSKFCVRCGGTNHVSLHHKTYDTIFGSEPDEHLCPLCECCHKLFHDTYGVKKDMMKETEKFIRELMC